MPVPGLPYDVTQPGLSPFVQAGAGATSLLTPYKRKYGRGQETTGAPVTGTPPADLSPAQQWQLLQGGATSVLNPYEEKFGRAQADAPAAPQLAPPPPQTAAPGVPAAPPPGLSAADEARWGGAGTQKQAGGYAAASATPWEGAGTQTFKPQADLPQPLAKPKPAGISAEEQQVLDAQDEKRQGALLGDIQKFQGYQKQNLAAAEGQASGRGGPPLPMLPALDTIGSGDTGGNFPDVANDYRGLELMRSLGMPVPSQQGSDAYAREKYAEKQKGFQDRRSKLLEESTGAMSPLQQQDLRRRYNQVGLEESQAPDMPPPLHLNVQQGDQSTRYAMPSEGRQRFVTPGTPEFEESQRAGTARSALAQALHDTPAWLKLEEARMHVQAQQAAEHKTTIERWWAAHPQGTAPQFESFLETLKASDTLRREKQGGGTQEPGLPSPGQAGGPMGPPEPGLPGAGGLSPGQAQLKAARDRAETTNILTPDEKEQAALQNTFENATTLDALYKAGGGNNVALRHPATRAMIAKAIQSQGGKSIPNLGSALEEAILDSLGQGGFFNPVRDGSGPPRVPDPVSVSDLTAGKVMAKQVEEGGLFSRPRLQVDSPWRTMEVNRNSGAGIQALTDTGKAEARKRAEYFGELLKLLHEQGYNLQ